MGRRHRHKLQRHSEEPGKAEGLDVGSDGLELPPKHLRPHVDAEDHLECLRGSRLGEGGAGSILLAGHRRSPHDTICRVCRNRSRLARGIRPPGVRGIHQRPAEPPPVGHLGRHLEEIPSQDTLGRLRTAGRVASRRKQAPGRGNHIRMKLRQRHIVGQPDREQSHEMLVDRGAVCERGMPQPIP